MATAKKVSTNKPDGWLDVNAPAAQFPITIPANGKYSLYWPATSAQKNNIFYKKHQYRVNVKSLRRNDDIKALAEFCKKTFAELDESIGEPVKWGEVIQNISKPMLGEKDYVVLTMRVSDKKDYEWINPNGEVFQAPGDLFECQLAQYIHDNTYYLTPKVWVQRRKGMLVGGATLWCSKVVSVNTKFSEEAA
jgi:hypothetical protein